MENGIKALYMVIGVFLGIMVLTLLVYVFREGSSFLETFENKESDKNVEQYNSKIIIYAKENNTIYDVISACNLAYDINKKNGYDNENYLEIEIKAGFDTYILPNSNIPSGMIEKSGSKISITELITSYGEVTADGEKREYVHTFNGKVKETNDKTGKINIITFTLN